MSNKTPDLRVIAIGLIRPNPVALRSVDRETPDFLAMRDSVRGKGIINPISVREKNDEDGTLYFEICDGLHRYTCATDVGLEVLPVSVQTYDEIETLEAQIVANLAKVDTKPVEYTKALQRMFVMNPTLTMAEMAEKIHVSPTWITQRLGLLKLHAEIQKYVDDGKISLPNAYKLSRLPVEEQLNFLEAALSQPAAEFAPQVEARLKALREAARQGKDASPPTFEASAYARKLSELKDENAHASAGPAIVASANIGSAVEGFAAGVRWALSLDTASVDSQRTKWQARQDKLAADKQARDLEKAEKKAAEAAADAAKVRATVAAATA